MSSRPAFLSAIEKPAQQQHTTLTFANRVAYQRAMEEVYWRHRIWPKERPDLKPSLDKVMSQAQLEKKVEEYLRDSQALEDYWQKPISAEQLQAEMERMAQHTKQPEVLRELFAALGNDPYVIAECLARPALSERLLTNFYAHDQRFHGELKQRAEAELLVHHTIEQIKQLGGTYTEIELVRSDTEEIVGQAPRLPNEELASGAPALQQEDSTTGLKLNSSEWDEELQKFAAIFGDAKNGRARPPGAPRTPRQSEAATAQITTRVLSPLQEDDDRYYTTAVLNKTKDRLRLATVEWRKEPLESWRARVENQGPHTMAAVSTNYTLPTISDAVSGCTNDTWIATSAITYPPRGSGHTAIWIGSEMIVWGGTLDSGNLGTGERYNPGTDTWTATSTTNAPTPRTDHTAVWTGSEMIIWGGYYDLNTGGRYNPSTDTWTVTSTTNAPAGRYNHTAVRSGTEMIVWGGQATGSNYLNTGGRYNPSADSWTATSTTNVPTGRAQHTAVWAAGAGFMVVWGGYDGSNYLNTGGRYNPIVDTWTPTSTTNAPTSRDGFTAVSTGSEMIIWGGADNSGVSNTGARYDPNTDMWTATNTTNAPSVRYHHTAIWSGNEMIIWGGFGVHSSDYLNDGGRYNPSTDSWTGTSTTNAPEGRGNHTAVWAGSEMIVWGGNGSNDLLNTGGRYNPSTDSWVPTNAITTPVSREAHTAVWTGSEMIIWGGFDGVSGHFSSGGKYNPSTDSWTATSTTNAPYYRDDHTAVWTGSEMIIWGGYDGNYYLSTGGRYNPGTDSWIATSNGPSGRAFHTAVWTGSEMIVWGGENNGSPSNTGGRYNPVTDTWNGTSTANAPAPREFHTAVWTGSEMIVWGGNSTNSNMGGRYNPTTDTWTATSTTNVPSNRTLHTAVWTGSEMIVWGGLTPPSTYLNTGGRYNPSTDSWTATSTTSAPTARDSHKAVWTGNEMVAWGGSGGSGYVNTGGRYNPGTDSWTTTTTTNAPSARYAHTAIWTGSEMIVWGGDNPSSGVLNTGGRYCAQSAPLAQSAFSRKVHGSAGTFDVPLPLTGNVGIECRSGGSSNDYQMIINFMINVTVQSASVTSGTGSVSNFSVNGPQVTVNLTGVTNVQRITVTLIGVNDGTHMGNVPVSMGVLIGDTTDN